MILFLPLLRAPLSSLFPYTTLFRSFAGRVRDGLPVLCHRSNGADPQSFGRRNFGAGAFGSKGLSRRRNWGDRKSTRLNSSHVAKSYAVFCLQKKLSPTTDHYITCLT